MSINDLIKVGNRIKSLRKNKKITQKEMAEKLGINYSTYSNYENNNRIPSIDVLYNIADTLGVKINDLVDTSISVQMNISEKPSSQAESIFNNLDQLRRIITENVRVYELANDNSKLVIELINKLLEDIIESIDFFSFILGNNDFETLSNTNSKLDASETNKLIKITEKRCKQMPLYIGKVSIDLHNLICHTQNLVDNVLKNIELNESKDRQ